MRCLLTGGRGFIASHLGNRLVELGHEVTGVDNLANPSSNKISFPCHDVNYREMGSLFDFDYHNFDVIFHLAAFINVDESIESPVAYFDNNAVRTGVLLDILRRKGWKGRF